MKRILLLIFAVLVIATCTYVIISSVQVARSTGILRVTSPGATITIVKPNYQSITIGIGTAAAHLTPGTYTVIVTKDRNQATKTVMIAKQTTISTTLPTVTKSQTRQATKITKANTLIKSLPYIGPDSEYEVSYQYQSSGSTAQPIIVVTGATTQAQQDGVAWIKSQGYDPTQLTIQYQTITLQNNNYTNGYPGN